MKVGEMVQLNSSAKKKYLALLSILVLIGAIFIFITQGILGDKKVTLISFILGNKESGTRVFGDYAQVVKFCVGLNPYEEYGSSYPPFALIVMLPFAYVAKSSASLPINKMPYESSFILSFTLYNLIVLSIISACIFSIVKSSKKIKATIVFLIVFSSPYLYALSRGNIVTLPFMFILLFITFLNSEKRWQRELSYLFLAVAGCIKIYPLIFGTLLLIKKDFRGSVKVAIYFFVITFLSFLCFKGGVNNVKLFFTHMGNFIEENMHSIKRTNASLQGMVTNSLLKLFKNAPDKLVSVLADGALVVAILLSIVAILVCILGSVDKHSLIFALCSVAIILPNVSFYYVAVIFGLPFAIFIAEFENYSKLYKIAFGFAYLMLFSIFAFNVVFGAIPLTAIMVCSLVYVIVRYSKNAVLTTKRSFQKEKKGN